MQKCNISFLFPFTARELGSGAFGKVFLADAMGILAFDPRGSTCKRRSSRRRFGGSVRRNHYFNNNQMTKVAVKTLKGILNNDGCFCHCRSSCRRRIVIILILLMLSSLLLKYMHVIVVRCWPLLAVTI